MDFPIHIDTISVGLSIVYLKGPQVDFSKFLTPVFGGKQTVKTLMNGVSSIQTVNKYAKTTQPDLSATFSH